MADPKKRKRASGGSSKKPKRPEAPAPDLTKLMDPPEPSLSSAQPEGASSETSAPAEKKSAPKPEPQVVVRQVADPNAMVYVTGKITDNVLVGKGRYCSVIKGKRTKVPASAVAHLKRTGHL